MNKGLFAGILVVILLLSPVVEAQSVNDLQSQIAILQKRLADLQKSKSEQGGAGTNSLQKRACLQATRTLAKTMKGDDVKSLQSFLIGKGLLPEDSASGYFGVLTETAVRKYQCDSLAICSGSSSATGWGSVGPRTRAVISSTCNSGIESSTATSTIQKPVTPNMPRRSSDTHPIFLDDYDDGAPYVPRIPQRAGLQATPQNNSNLQELNSLLMEASSHSLIEETNLEE